MSEINKERKRDRVIVEICQWCAEHTVHDVLYAHPRGFCSEECKHESMQLDNEREI